MKRPTLRTSLALSSVLSLLPATGLAQTPPPDAPPPPPPPVGAAALQCPVCEPDAADQRAIDEASELLVGGRAAEAQRVLQPRLAGQSPWGRSYSSLAVLDRLATRLATQAPDAARPGATAPVDETREPRGGVEAAGLYTSAILLGIGTGVWLDVMFEVDEIQGAVVLPLLLGGAGAGGLYLAERVGGPIRRGRGTAMSNGFLLGLTAGTLLGVYGGEELRWRGRGVATSIWGGAVLGAGLGYGLGALAESRPASASFVGSGGLWGAAFGATVGGLIDADEEDVLLAALVGEVVGAGAAAALAATLHPGEAQVRWMDLGILSGGLVGTGLAVLIFGGSDLRSPTVPMIFVEAGMIGGGILGYVLGRPSTPAAATRTASRDRFETRPSVAPLPGGAQVMLSLPNLL